jgi:ribosomal-protein-alanine N-acetyltransferase
VTHPMNNNEHSPIILETERLTLRHQQASDVAPLVDLWADPDVTRYMGGPRGRAWLQSAFEETARDPYAERYDLWPLVEKETGQVIGHCGLLDKEVEGRPEIELTYVLASSAWGKGYATEIGQALKGYAFEEMGLGRLIALIEPENSASERVAEKVGMRLEKEVVRPGGELRRVYAVERESHRFPGVPLGVL